LYASPPPPPPPSFPTRRSSDLTPGRTRPSPAAHRRHGELVAAASLAIDLLAFAEFQLARETDAHFAQARPRARHGDALAIEFRRSEEHTSELQSLAYLVCRLLL